MTSFENGHFISAKKMQTIFVANQAFGQMKANVFEGAVQLQKLHMENCLISSVHQKTFQDLKTLTELSLQGNLLKSLPEYVFSVLHEMETLNLKNNLLTTLPPKLFELNQKLKKLFLNVNRLLFIPAMTLKNDVEIIQLQENLCTNEVFHNVAEFQKKTGKMCDISLNPLEIFQAYKNQQNNAHNCNSKDKDKILEIKDTIKALKEKIVQLKSSKENFNDILEAVENVEVCGTQRNEL